MIYVFLIHAFYSKSLLNNLELSCRIKAKAEQKEMKGISGKPLLALKRSTKRKGSCITTTEKISMLLGENSLKMRKAWL